MNKQVCTCLVLAFAFLISSVSFCYAQDWELIGQVKVAKKKNKADINIINQKTSYKQLKFGVQMAPIEIKRIVAYAIDGNEYQIDISDYIRPGENTPPISLSQDGLALSKVMLVYYAKKRVIVDLYGK